MQLLPQQQVLPPQVQVLVRVLLQEQEQRPALERQRVPAYRPERR